ncbi:AMP-binding protein [Halpernia frigidisoli]|uniref:O-succinylbenzoic acid--CoA ligase n=1 Tax=Halpernia frigidisoli TaxID=1125876 RepID=A0A1I3J732_9FLAO|nr:AMP-binding protein [Halpernia frigidisoli]SFI56037.1 O-succinylbenzoic acid--CoA ligase [Halpernia frigidisoli]
MIINFQNFEIENYAANNAFEQQVLDFVKVWLNNDKFISVKTSGSTGVPKIISVEKEKMRNSARMTCDFLNLKSGQSALLCLPVDYISGKMMIVRGIERNLILHVKSPELKALQEIKENINFCAMTPLQVENSIENLSRINKIIIGGAKVSEDLKNKIQEKLQLENTESEIYETYGMSETLSHIALRMIYPKNEDFFKAFDEIDISVDNRNCLRINAPTLNPEILQTNDIVEMVDEKRFKFIGRADFIINSGGIKISPEILEKKVKETLTSELVFVGLDDIVLGEKLVLVIEGEEDNEISGIISALEFPSKNHRPKNIYFLKSFPRTETGKILRKDIKVLIENLK